VAYARQQVPVASAGVASYNTATDGIMLTDEQSVQKTTSI
jgi:hypothetical protein